MSLPPVPFTSAANRLSRPHDEAFFSLMEGEKAIVRLLGPRRIGKTELVSHFVRTTRAPLLNVKIKPVPVDLAPAPVVAAILDHEIATLAETAPKLHALCAKMAAKTLPVERRRSMGAEVGAGVAKVTASAEHSTAARVPAPTDADVEIAGMLRRLELAADRLGLRPVVFFDEVQELVLHADSGPGMATVWAIRNEVQHHTACRYVFAGSNQRVFAKLQTGRSAPLLNLGSALEIPPLTTAEIDAWALPLFAKGRRHVRSLAAATELLCGKIGEIVEVCTWLWVHSKAGDLLDEAVQRDAVLAVARQQEAIELLVRSLTVPQTAVLRWILLHPGTSPFGKEALAATKLTAGTVNTALRALVQAELVEGFSRNQYAAATPLRMFATLAPESWTRRPPPGR